MIVSRKKKFIFIHVPKTGGTSLAEILSKHAPTFSNNGKWKGRISRYAGPNVSSKLLLFPKHTSINAGRRLLKSRMYQDYYKFAFIRNPFDFIVSSYFYQKSDPENINYKLVNSFSGFEEFVTQMNHSPSYQKDFVTIDGKCEMDFLGDFNNFNDEIKKISSLLDIDFTRLDKKNTSSHKRFEEYYSKALKDRVSTLYKDDIEFYNSMFNVDCRDF